MATAENTKPADLPMDAIREALLAALADLGIGAEQAVPDARLRDDLELDSTEIVQISLDLTRRLGVKVKLEDAADLTLAEVGDLVRRTAGTPAAGRR